MKSKKLVLLVVPLLYGILNFTSCSCSDTTHSYVVKKGDTFYKIYKDYAKSISFEEFKRMNRHLLEENGSYDRLNIGDEIFLSRGDGYSIYHLIQKILNTGESLESMVKKESVKTWAGNVPDGIFYQPLTMQSYSGSISYDIIQISYDKIKSGSLKLKISSSSERVHDLSDLANGVIAAINGGYFKKNNAPIGYLRSENHTINKSSTRAKNKGYFVIMKSNNEPKIIRKLGNINRYSLIIESYPLIRLNNRSWVTSSNSPDSRSAIAVDAKKNVYLISTQGVFSNYVMYLDLLELAKSKGFTSMLNLDGGFSSSIYLSGKINKKSLRGVVNSLAVYKNQ